MKTVSSLLIFVLLTLLSCSKKIPPEPRVGMDPSWSPLEYGVRNNNISAFSTEILTEIGKMKKIPFAKILVNWNDLIDGLQKGKYEAILSSKTPEIFNQSIFDFSDIYLPLGPVLVVPVSSKIDSLDHLNGKKIAIISGSNTALILEKSQGVLIVNYNSIPTALNDTLVGHVDGVLIDILSAAIFCQDLYDGELKIATRPLNEEGLRLITKHNRAPDLIKGFNEGLKRMKQNGSDAKLLDKWGL